MELDYKQEIKLNKYLLDAEIEKQPYTYLYFAELLIEAKKTVNELKLLLKQTRAGAELQIRKNPPENVKITESVVSAYVDVDPEVGKVEKNLNEAYYQTEQLEAIVEAFKQKKSMINDLVQLYSVNFWVKQDMTKDVHIKTESDYQNDSLLEKL